MREKHGFFVPDASYCVNSSGLIHYLREKIEIGLLCISCNNNGLKIFQDSDAVRQHMVIIFCFRISNFEEIEATYNDKAWASQGV